MTTITITDKGLERWLKDYAREEGMSLDEATQNLLRFLQGLRERGDTLLSGWNREELRAEIQKGLHSGETTPFDIEEFLEGTHTRFEIVRVLHERQDREREFAESE